MEASPSLSMAQAATTTRVEEKSLHTPPSTDQASSKDGDIASTSSLSDLEDEPDVDLNMEMDADEENTRRFEEAARSGEEAAKTTEIKPAYFDGGVPVFRPTLEEFKDFQKYVGAVSAYGLMHGIVLIDPPDKWKAERKPLDELVKHVRINRPITQEFHGRSGIYTQRNMEKMRSYNLPQWKALCEQTENQPPAKRGEKRLNADKLLGRGQAKKKTESTPVPEGAKRRGRPPRVKREPTQEPDAELQGPPTPTSPETKPVLIKPEEEEDEPPQIRQGTPGRGKRGGRRGSAKPRGRQPKAAGKKEGGGKSTETTVAARRLRNTRAAADEIDEEAFDGFDYRVHDNDQWTAERCNELEDKYWKSLSFSNPMYAADMPGSLFDDETKDWNVAKLPNLLDMLGQPIPGVNTAYLYLGMWRATFAWHLEDVDLYSINYIHFGAPKQWYSISQKDAPKFEAAMKSIWPSDAKNCDQFLRHKTYLVSPQILKSQYGVEVNKIVHREGQFVITFPIGYHSGYNLGYNCAESVNFALENWLPYGKTARKCQCEADSVFIDVDWFIRRINGEPSPEYEEVEITDDEDDGEDPTDLPTPPGSDHGKTKPAQKRKRPPKDQGPNKRAKKIVKVRKISKNQPCCLCPNDFAWEELLPTTSGNQAHRICAMFTPETYIATEEGNEKVFNVENISKARLDLRCHECKQKKGSCFQCSSAKCTRAYHATCAMHAGVQVDKGEISVWHEGVEYRDVGFDWRCRLHRTVKRTRITSELSQLNHAMDWLQNREFMEYLFKLASGEVIQWQATNGDEIQAGVVISSFDAGQNSVLVSVLPEQSVTREVDPAWVLFVDSSTSCLQRPSANALDLPEELQGKTGSLPGSTEKKPSEGDPFTEDPKTEWAEFVVECPPLNKWQKSVNLNQEKQIFYFLGETSTESKAQYTADPTKRVHDPASNFLDRVEPAKMAPPPQPKRASLGASYPRVNFPIHVSPMFGTRPQPTQYNPAANQSPVAIKPGDLKISTPQGVSAKTKTGRIPKSSHQRDVKIAAEAKANEQARIQQRQQAKVQTNVDVPEQTNLQSVMDLNNNTSVQFGNIQPGPNPNANVWSHQQQFSSSPQPMLGPYHQPLPNYYATQASHQYAPPMPNAMRPQAFQYSHEWMTPGGMNQALHFGSGHPSPAMPTMESNSPELTYKPPMPSTPRPRASTFAHPNQSSSDPFLGHSSVGQMNAMDVIPNLKREAPSIESARGVASTFAPPRTPTEFPRPRRVSNPSYPFKSPEQIAAQKEEREKNGSQSSGSRPVSRPGSGYSTAAFPSPGLTAMQQFPEPNPPLYINPNMTQISPPGTSAGISTANLSVGATITGPRCKSASVSAGVGNMGPPVRHFPAFRRTLSSSNLVPMDLDRTTSNSSTGPLLYSHSYSHSTSSLGRSATIPQLSVITSFQGPMLRPGSVPGSARALSRSRRHTLQVPTHIAEPNDVLSQSLVPRPVFADGTPRNDRSVPRTIQQLQEQGGFWGKIANYFNKKHEMAATVYKSPFGHGSTKFLLGMSAPSIGSDEGLAGRWHTTLDDESREKVDDYRAKHPMGSRP